MDEININDVFFLPSLILLDFFDNSFSFLFFKIFSLANIAFLYNFTMRISLITLIILSTLVILKEIL